MKFPARSTALAIALAAGALATPAMAAQITAQIDDVQRTTVSRQIQQTVCDQNRNGPYYGNGGQGHYGNPHGNYRQPYGGNYGNGYVYRDGYYGDSANNEALIGSAIGGAIGSQVARNSTQGAIIGAVIGGTIGNQVGRDRNNPNTYGGSYGNYGTDRYGNPYPYGNYGQPYGGSYGNGYVYRDGYYGGNNPYNGGYGNPYGQACRQVITTQQTPAWRAIYTFRGNLYSTVLDWQPRRGQIIRVEEPNWRDRF